MTQKGRWSASAEHGQVTYLRAAGKGRGDIKPEA